MSRLSWQQIYVLERLIDGGTLDLFRKGYGLSVGGRKVHHRTVRSLVGRGLIERARDAFGVPYNNCYIISDEGRAAWQAYSDKRLKRAGL